MGTGPALDALGSIKLESATSAIIGSASGSPARTATLRLSASGSMAPAPSMAPQTGGVASSAVIPPLTGLAIARHFIRPPPGMEGRMEKRGMETYSDRVINCPELHIKFILHPTPEVRMYAWIMSWCVHDDTELVVEIL